MSIVFKIRQLGKKQIFVYLMLREMLMTPFLVKIDS